MKATALFPDGFRTDQTPKRQTFQLSLANRSIFKIHILGQTCQSSLQRLSASAFMSAYRTPSPVCHCPILVRKPSGSQLPFKFKASIAGGGKGSSTVEDAARAIAGGPSDSSYKTDGCSEIDGRGHDCSFAVIDCSWPLESMPKAREVGCFDESSVNLHWKWAYPCPDHLRIA
jgi:hypothetical protein